MDLRYYKSIELSYVNSRRKQMEATGLLMCGHSCMGFITHWGRVTHICVGNLTMIGSDNGLGPGRRKDIIWNNAGILLIGPLGTNLSEILIEIHPFSFKKMHLKTSSGKWPPFCLGFNVLMIKVYGCELNMWPKNDLSNTKAIITENIRIQKIIIWLTFTAKNVFEPHSYIGLW